MIEIESIVKIHHFDENSIYQHDQLYYSMFCLFGRFQTFLNGWLGGVNQD